MNATSEDERTPPAGTTPRTNTLRTVRRIALAIGIVLFFATLYFLDPQETLSQMRRLGFGLLGALLFSGLWHLTRTWAWAWSFPQPRTVRFATLARVRIAAEAFSYLTLRGVAGEPLKVVLLSGAVDARQATAAVALERIAYSVGTTLTVGIGSLVAIAFVPLTRTWFRVFRAFAIVAAVLAVLAGIAIAVRGTYLQSLMRAIDRRTGLSMTRSRVGGFVASVDRCWSWCAATRSGSLSSA